MWSKWPWVSRTRRTPVARQTSSSSSCSLAASTRTASPVCLHARRRRCSRRAPPRACRSRRLVVAPRSAAQSGDRLGAVGPRTGELTAGQVRSAGPMDFRDTPAEAAFRDEVRTWLSEHLVGEFAEIGPGGGPADETGYDLRIEWETARHGPLGRAAWPEEYGGRNAGIVEQVIFNEEYAKAGARPGSASSAKASSPRRSSPTAPRSRSSASCPRSRRSRSCGARATPSRTPARTSSNVQCRGPCSTATSGSSTARRSGPRSRTAPTGASASAAPIPRRRRTRSLVPPRPDGPARRRRSRRWSR